MYEVLTKFIPELEGGIEFGKWIFDEDTSKGYFHEPYVQHSKIENDIFYALWDNYISKMDLYEKGYFEIILYNLGIHPGTRDLVATDASNMDGKTVLALLQAAYAWDRFSPGSIEHIFEKGCILSWLKRLKEIDEEKTGANNA